MNPQCTKCAKTVYSQEKLNCLDKIWHKTCFRCVVCNMALNMKNYKGYNKNPYCNAHYPTPKFTAVADTPENLRLKKQTDNQSSLKYHKEYEQEKGKFTVVADDPEVLRARKSTTVQEELSKSHQRPCDDQPAAPYQPAPLQQVPQPSSSNSAQYLVMYDYNAADDDEVSMVEGDIIVDAEIIDEGWMVGRVKRTGQSGMLPANYVQLNN
uniref:LIM and SH3 domain protein 3 n=1 Tax=Nematostella vectensis TaxID=45351 RepID=I2G9D2_NEMVE|nr:LIM and SH3 domain protein 3 [Nematostella vectensis]